MPVKWNDTKDRWILLALCAQVRPVKADWDNIRNNWPFPEDEVPTQKALTEHLVKLKKSIPGFNNGPASAPATPIKRSRLDNNNSTPVSKKSRHATKNDNNKKDDSDEEDLADAEIEDLVGCATKFVSKGVNNLRVHTVLESDE